MNGVIYRQADPSLTNHRDRRSLFGVYNNDPDLGGYAAKQIKVLIMYEDDYLGKTGHYHVYPELYFVVKGQVIFDLWDRTTGEKNRYLLRPSDILLVPSGMAHRAYAKAGTTLLGSSAEAYSFDPPSDIPADFEPLGPLPYGLK